jgi:hypothetical protein
MSIRRRSLVVPLFFASSLSLIAQVGDQSGSRKQSWEWTLEERVALRTSAAAAAERLRGHRDRVGANATADSGRVVDRFTGRTHPELFLPVEVFDQLVEMGFNTDPRSQELMRRALRSELVRHGMPADFWERLRVVATIYIADVQALRATGAALRGQTGAVRERTEQTLALKHTDVCRSRAAALAAARADFGRERFDRFLYEVIAVSMFHAADTLQDPAVLRRMERGCQ